MADSGEASSVSSNKGAETCHLCLGMGAPYVMADDAAWALCSVWRPPPPLGVWSPAFHEAAAGHCSHCK